MTGPALEPELAADYVRELSAEITAVVVLDGEGKRLVGPEDLAARARKLPPGVHRAAAGTTWVAGDGAHTLAAFAGPGAPAGPTELDLRTALEALKTVR